jgi:hypothetical protein
MNKICPTCSKEIRANNFNRHFNICGILKPQKKIRGIDFDPNKGFKTGNRVIWNKGKTKETDSSLLAASNKMKELGHGGWSKSACSNGGKTNGGYKPNAGRSKKYYVDDSFGTKVCLQSSYELLCSQILDKLEIKWIRPPSLKYGDKRYFPDFLLVDSGIYLDPKNDYLAIIDKEKIENVMKENFVKVIILTKDMINEQSLRSILDMQSTDNR